VRTLQTAFAISCVACFAIAQAPPKPAATRRSTTPTHKPDAKPNPEDKWEVQYLYDDPLGSLRLTDLQFASEQRGIASGVLTTHQKAGLLHPEAEKDTPIVLVTSNGGKNWTQIPVKAEANSLFFLDDTTGWLVADDGLWFTNEAGRNWKQISKQKSLLQVDFLTAAHGYAVGGNQQALETFDDNKNGIITGFSRPPRRDDEQDLSNPDAEIHRKQVPNVLIFLETKDGGNTWKTQKASLFGEVTHMSLTTRGFGLGLIEFQQEFYYPSEVYKIDLDSGASERIYRDKDRAITDVLCLPDRDCFLAGIQPPGKIHPSPIPGKVHILRSDGLENWDEMPVDYRASARRIWLASPGTGIWAATDTGIIMKLRER
jgi:photosystem II stability/assembly factor-like uncharacterized protein